MLFEERNQFFHIIHFFINFLQKYNFNWFREKICYLWENTWIIVVLKE